VDGAGRSFTEFGFGGGEDSVATSADVDRGSEFEEALRRGFAQARAAARDQDTFVFQEIFLEHEAPSWTDDCSGAEATVELSTQAWNRKGR